MRAAFCPRVGDIILRDAEAPRPTKPGEVVVRVRRCGICGSDLHWYKGEAPLPTSCPGHEISGVVEALGPGAHAVREGDRVVVEATRSCGRCSYCHEGRTQLCVDLTLLGLTAPGGFADCFVTDSRHLHPIPPAIDDEIAILTEPLAVAIHSLRIAALPRGGRVLILGGGSLGLVCASAARDAGAGEIVISARRPHQRAAARALGATRAIEPHDLQRPEAPGDFDVVLDTVADPDGSLDQGLGAARAGGAVVVLGVFTRRPSFDAVRLMSHEIRLLGAMCYGRGDERADFEIALDLLGRQSRQLRGLVTHRVGLEDLAEGFRLAADKSTGSIKVSVAISEPEPPRP